jgi:hypothetical protein
MPLDSFTCEAYVKTQIRTRKLPDRLIRATDSAKG